MKQTIFHGICVGLLVLSIVIIPSHLRAQETSTQQADAFSILGSTLLSVLHFPLKLATCAGTQVGAAVTYTATFDVAGNYDGGTNGRGIGEVARRSCAGNWIITPEQVKKDYQ